MKQPLYTLFSIGLLILVCSVPAFACDNYTNGGSIGGNGVDEVISTHCYNYTHQPVIIPTSPSGGSGGSAVYQWEASFENGPWQAIPGATGNGFQYAQSAAALAGMGYTDNMTLSLRRGARRPICSDWVYTNVRTFQIIHEVDPGILSGVRSNCTEYNVTLYGLNLNLAIPSGGDSPYEYNWEISTDESNWTFYSSEANPEIDTPPGSLRYFRRGVRPLGSSCGFRYTNSCAFYYIIGGTQLEGTGTNPSCYGNDDGQIDIQDVNGNSPEILNAIEFSIDGINWFAGNTLFANLEAGTYEIQARSDPNFDKVCLCPNDNLAGDYRICDVPVVILTTPPPIEMTGLSVLDPTDCNVADGEIQFTISGGVPPYSVTAFGETTGNVTISTTQVANLFNLPADTYFIEVEDDAGNGCRTSISDVVLSAPPLPNINNVTATDPTDCDAQDGTITISASAGTGAIQFSISGESGPWESNSNFNNLPPGNYDIWVRNDNGTCPVPGPSITLSDPPMPVIDDIVFTDPTDCDAQDGTISVTVSGGTGTFVYSINGNNAPWENRPDFVGLMPGYYDVWVSNDNGTCPVQGIDFTLSDPPLPVIDEVTATDPTDCDAQDGTIAIAASSGTGAFQFSISGNNGPWENSPNFSNLAPGTYDIWVRNDSGTCPVQGNSITLSDPPLPVIDEVTATDPTDCDAQDGTISIAASAGTGAFQFSISGENGPWESTPNFSNLAPGTYDVWVRNDSGTCPVQGTSITLSDPPLPAIDEVTATDPTDCDAQDGTISIAASAGTGTFQFSISGENGPWESSPNFSNLAPGSYDIWVRNDSGTCPVQGTSITLIDPPLPVIDEVTATDPTDCDAQDGTISIAASAGTGAFQFSISGENGPWENSPNFSNLAPGTYDIWVRNDSGTCPVQGNSITLSDPPLPVIDEVTANDPTDCDAQDGTIAIAASAGTGSYEYSINGENGPWESSPNFNNLAPGSYDVWVRNESGTCPVPGTSITLSDPPLPVIDDVTATDPTDCDAQDGTIIIAASAGTGAFQYSINGENGPWESSPNFSNLSPGNYEVWVRNDSGTCPVQGTSITLNDPPLPVIDDVTATDPTDCGAQDGTIAIAASAGTGAFQFSINGENGPWESSPNFSNLAPGSYDIWVRNDSGTCPIQGTSITLNDPPLPIIDDVTATDPTDCGAQDGTIAIAASAGTGAFQFSINGENGPWESSPNFSNLAPGSYDVWVRNESGTCPVQGTSITLSDPPLPVIDEVTATDPTDCDAQDGTIAIAASAGTGAFQFSINGDNGPWESSPNFSNLAPGNYDVWVRNDSGTCPVQGTSIILSDPPLPIIDDVTATDPTDCDAQDGTIAISASAGTGTYEYSINGENGPWESSPNFSNLATGTYEVWIRNDSGTCPVQGTSITLSDPPLPVIDDVTATDPTDCDAQDGTITIDASSGTGAFQFSISGENGPWESSTNFSNLAPGIYDIWVRNESGTCPVPGTSITLSDPPLPVIDEVTATDPTDCDAQDGTIIIAASAGTGTYEYSINGENGPWESSPNFSNLAPGSYDVWVRNESGTCPVQGTSITLSDPPLPVIDDVTATDPTDCDAQDGTISIAASAGTSSYEYSINGENGPWESSPNFSNLAPGSYEVWVRNESGTCPVQGTSINLSDPPLPIIDDVTYNGASDCDTTDGFIQILTTGSGNYQFSINGNNWQDAPIFENLDAGTYTAFIRNTDGTCPVAFPGSIVLVAPDAPSINEVITTQISECDGSNASIEIIASAGSSLLEYSIGNGWTMSNVFHDLPAGTYNVSVRNDDETCQVDFAQTITITPLISPELIMVEVNDATDCNLNNGEVIITASGGDNNLRYSLNGGTPQSSPIFSNLAPGNYLPQVSNNDGTCIVSGDAITITAPVAPVLGTPSINAPTDCESTDASITLNASGGSGNLLFSLNGGTPQSSPIFSNLAPGTYLPQVSNSDGTCVVSGDAITITAPVAPVLGTPSVNAPTDCESTDASITLIANGGSGNLLFSLNGGTPQSSPTFSNLAPGTYLPQVSNSDGTCVVVGDAIVITAPVAPVLGTPSVNDPTDCESTDASITLNASGGSGNLLFSLNGGTPQSSPTFSNLAPGTYLPQVSNSDGTCIVSGDAITITAPVAPVLGTPSVNAPTDCESSDASITLIANGGSGNLLFFLNGGTPQSSPIFSNLPPGNYLPQVSNSDGSCVVSGDAIVITAPVAPVLGTPSVNDPTNCESTDASITLNASGGSGNLLFSLNGSTPQSSPIFSNLTPGTYQSQVSNSDGTCVVVGDAIVITAPVAPVLGTPSVNAPTDCESTDASITLNASGGSGNLLFSLNNGTPQSSPIFSNLAPGTYLPQVSNSDGTCIVVGDAIVITAPVAPVLGAPSINDPTNCESTDASITLNASGGSGNLLFSLNGGTPQSSPIFSNLPPGNYLPQVSNSDGTCVVNGEAIVITAPVAPVLGAPSINDPTDCESADASITLTASGGSGNLLFSLNGGTPQNSPIFSNLAPGTYLPQVSNSDGTCIVSGEAITITAPVAPVLGTPIINAATSCESTDASITLTASGGSGNLLFSLNGSTPQSSPIFSNLAPGTYLPQVSNSDGTCVVVGEAIVITAPLAPILGTPIINAASSCESTDASITLNANGGSGNLLFSLNGGTPQSSPIFSNLASGTYLPQVSNNDGTCVVSGEVITITAPIAPVLGTPIINAATSCESTDASITLTASSGSGNLLFSLNGGTPQSSPIFSNLAPGTYLPQVSNSDGTCIVVGDAIVITAPVAPVLGTPIINAATSCESADASITLSASGGNGNLLFSLNGGTPQSSPIFSNLAPGTYLPQVSNSDGTCVVVGDAIVITAPVAPVLGTPIINAASSCESTDASITLNASGGSGNLLFSLNNGTPQSSPIFSNLAPGTYLPQVSNSDGTCIVVGDAIVITAPVAPVLGTPIINSASSCESTDASITLTASGGSGNLLFSLNGGTPQSSPIFSNLAPGTYLPQVSNSDGTCVFIGDAIVIEAGAVEYVLTFDNLIPTLTSNCLSADGELLISPEGGSGSYEFSIDGGLSWSTDSLFTGLSIGYYEVQIRDIQNPCRVSELLTVELFPVSAPQFLGIEVVAPSDCEAMDGTITIDAFTPTGSLLYSFDGGQTWGPDATLSEQSGGTYTPAIQNPDNGCILIYPEEVIMNTPTYLEIDSITISQVSDCGLDNGSIHIFTNDPEALFEVSYLPGNWQFTTDIGDLPPGEYVLNFRNIDGSCQQTWPSPIAINEPVQVQIDSIQYQEPSACNVADGQLSIFVSESPDWEFRLNATGAWLPQSTYNNLPSGAYIVQARLANWPNCSYTYPDTLFFGGALDTSGYNVQTLAAADCIEGGQISITVPQEETLLYSVDGGANWFNTPQFTALPPATYQVLVADTSLFCQAILAEELVLEGPPPPSIVAYNIQAADDCAASNGAIALFSNGALHQVYSIDGGINWDNDGIFDELPLGQYTLLMWDTLTGCEAIYPDTLTVLGIVPLQADSFQLSVPACADMGPGSAYPFVSGGEPFYSYAWSDGSFADSLLMNEPGTYQLVLSDARGCTDTLNITWPAYPTLADWGIVLNDTTLCAGSQYNLTTSLPEVADYYWTMNGAWLSDSTTLLLDSAGVYTLNVISLEGCLLVDSLLLNLEESSFTTDFLLPTEGVINEPVIAIDISWPVPQAITWIYDTNLIQQLGASASQEILLFPEPGWYTIGLQADMGGCVAFLEKEIHIYSSRDSLQVEPLGPTFEMITGFEVYPNPNDGNFQVQLTLTEALPAEFWLFDEQAALIHQQELNGQAYYELPFNNLSLPAGIYTAIARVGESWRYLNFIVL